MTLLWSPQPVLVNDADLLARIAKLEAQATLPMSDQATRLLDKISSRLLSASMSRQNPQLMALGYWLRPAALKRMIAQFSQHTRPNIFRVPRGIAMHLPPNNVDTIFVYSWAISVLAGNANVVRLPSSPDATTRWLADLIATTIQELGEADRHIFCSFAHETSLIADISAVSDLRIIWGGDNKVLSVSTSPTRPDGLTLGFPDRSSFSIINMGSYAAASEADRDMLAKDYYNDIFWFDQMGCGSPRLLVWVGAGDYTSLMNDLSNRLVSEARHKSYSIDTAVAIHKLHGAAAALADGIATQAIHLDNILEILATDQPELALEQRIGAGFLYYCQRSNIEDVASLVSRKVQTITHYGFDEPSLQSLARRMAGRGGYRLVRPGKALQFDAVWDGLSLFEHMTRQLTIDSA